MCYEEQWCKMIHLLLFIVSHLSVFFIEQNAIEQTYLFKHSLRWVVDDRTSGKARVNDQKLMT